MYIGTLLKEENPRSNKYIYIMALHLWFKESAVKQYLQKMAALTRLKQWEYQCHVNKKGGVHKAPSLDKELPATNAR